MPRYKTKSKSATPYKVQVLDRTFSMLDLLAQEGPDLSLAEISLRLKLHKSTTHRLLMVLEQQKYIEKNFGNGRYRLGLKLFELGRKAVSRFDLREKARPFLERLVFESGETVHLCILDGADVVYMDKVEPERSVRMASRVGSRNPAYCTSVGKAIMAYLPEQQVENILRGHGMKPRTKHTIHSVFDMKQELKKIRAQGYSVDNEENEEGVRCVGCVVRGPVGEPLAAISVSGPSFRVALDKLAELAKPIKVAAYELSIELGFHNDGDSIQNPKNNHMNSVTAIGA